MIQTAFKSMTPAMKALFFMLLFMLIAGVGSAVAIALSAMVCDTGLPDLAALASGEALFTDPCQLQVMNAANQVLTFLGAALVFLLLFGRASVDNFRLNAPTATFWLVPLLAVFALPLIQASYDVNRALIGKEGYLAKLFQPGEELAEQMTEAMLNMPNVTSLLINLLVVAVIPAVCEELAFRGVLQIQLSRMFKNVHAGIWVSAFVFSFIHFQFYGFLPRMLLGAFFGYLLVHTGSIWAPILAHFLNNAAAVSVHYVQLHHPTVEVDLIEDPSANALSILVACVGFSLLFWVVLHHSAWPAMKQRYLTDEDTRRLPSVASGEADPK